MVAPTFESKLVDLHNLETKLHDETWGVANKNGVIVGSGLWDVMGLMFCLARIAFYSR